MAICLSIHDYQHEERDEGVNLHRCQTHLSAFSRLDHCLGSNIDSKSTYHHFALRSNLNTFTCAPAWITIARTYQIQQEIIAFFLFANLFCCLC